jgi:predicted hotdog family 3-hydroxylacyl-ACP dehydratase
MRVARDELMTLIPHRERMCVLDAVESWDARRIRCSSQSHRDPKNPLRRNGRLSALHLAEYGAQAMAVHGGLLAREKSEKAPAGFLAALRDLKLSVPHIDDISHALEVEAEALVAADSGWMYAFTISAAGSTLASGRASVIFTGAIP